MHSDVSFSNAVAQWPLISGSSPALNILKAESNAGDNNLHRLASNLASSAPFFYSSETELGESRPQWPHISRENVQDDILLQNLGQQHTSCTDVVLGRDDPGQDCDSTLLLTKMSQGKMKRRRAPNRYQKRTLRTYYDSAKSLCLVHWQGVGGLFSAYRQSRGMNQRFVRYDQITEPWITNYISEAQFWLLLKRFFGLVPLSGLSAGDFPQHDKINYIKNYLRSKPTPRLTGDGEDDSRDLVRICTKLTDFIFRNADSKKIFLGANRGFFHRSPSPTWEVFQGFGLVDQFCRDAGSSGYSDLHRDAWLLVGSTKAK
ncbi:hypothetical protein N7523_005814 [Penicillium sp. IBT 18751x]|nr:hypothetical protein N7523_005814 [Penicillium sp. IBT 18751x]